jgi:prepilin-type N-terminal cleavage/methylation domain-containing protein
MKVKCPDNGQSTKRSIANCKLQIANCKLRNSRPSPLAPRPSSLAPRHSPLTTSHLNPGFTLIELLVTIAIIGILAGMALGAIRYVRHSALETKTKATIAKLNALVMQRYESYVTRRVPLNTSGLSPRIAAKYRYLAILDLMRMEMPERPVDILDAPLNLSSGAQWTERPALTQLFLKKYTANPFHVHPCAKLLFMWISMTYPEALEQFGQDEIADVDGDGWPVFVDAWGMPIYFLRWAPGFLPPNSDIQSGDPINDHDPYDTQRIYANTNYRLIPLIYSPGPDKKYGINVVNTSSGGVDWLYGVTPDTTPPWRLEDLNPYDTPTGGQAGAPTAEKDGTTNTHLDNIHNHRIEQQ